jgi:hemerythrin superfamily protein
MHSAAQSEMDGETTVVDKRLEEEDRANQAIAEMEELGTDSPLFPDKFEHFRKALVAHAEAEEHEELPKLAATFGEAEITRMREALARVPALASRNGDPGATFKDHLQAAREEFRTGL